MSSSSRFGRSRNAREATDRAAEKKARTETFHRRLQGEKKKKKKKKKPHATIDPSVIDENDGETNNPSVESLTGSNSISRNTTAGQQQVHGRSTTDVRATAKNTSRIARDFRLHLQWHTDQSNPKSAKEELTELQERLGRLLSKAEYFACSAVHADFEDLVKLHRLFDDQAEKSNAVRGLARTPSTLAEATAQVVIKTPIAANTMLQVLRQLDLQIGADVVDISAYVEGVRHASTAQVAVSMGEALSTLRHAQAVVRVSIDKSIVTIRARTLESVQNIDWCKLLSDVAFFLLRRGCHEALELATSTYHITIVVSGETARLTWNLLRAVWNNARALGGWAKQKVKQKLEERLAKRKCDEIEDQDEQEGDYTGNNKCVRLNNYREPVNQNIDTPGLEMPTAPQRKDTWFLRMYSELPLKYHYCCGDTIIFSHIVIKYPSYTVDREFFHSCQTSLAELGIIIDQWGIAAGHVFDIIPHQAEYKASSNGMWEVIDNMIWDTAHPRKPYHQSSANAVFAQPTSSSNLLPSLNAQEAFTEVGEGAVAQGSQSQWQHMGSHNDLAKTIGNHAMGSVTHPQPSTILGESSASQLPTVEKPVPGPPAPGFVSSAVSTTSTAAAQGFLPQSALPAGPPVFNAAPTLTQTPGFGSDVPVSASPSFALGGSQGKHAKQLQGTSLAAQVNAVPPSSQTQTLSFGAAVNAPSSFAFGGSQAAQVQQSQPTSITAQINTSSASAQTQTSGFGTPINAPLSFAFGGSQGTHAQQSQHAYSSGQNNTVPTSVQNQTGGTSTPQQSPGRRQIATLKKSRAGTTSTAATAPAPLTEAQLKIIAQIDAILQQADTMVQHYDARHTARADVEELKALERKLITQLHSATPLEWQAGDSKRCVSAWLYKPHQWIQRRYMGVVKQAESDVFDFSKARLNQQDGIVSFER